MRRPTTPWGRGPTSRRRRPPSGKALALRSVPGLAALPAAERGELGELFDEVRVAAGTVLAREGRAATELVLILDGRATATGSSAPERTVGAGQFVGELELVGQADHAATVTAETPMHLLVAGPATVRTVLEQPAVLRHIVTALGERLRAAGPTATVPEPAA